MTKQTIITATYNEIDTLIRTHFPMKPDYECVASEEWSNDTSHTFAVTGEMDKFMQEDVLSFQTDPHFQAFWRLPSLLNYLAAQGAIEKGNYLIEVSW